MSEILIIKVAKLILPLVLKLEIGCMLYKYI